MLEHPANARRYPQFLNSVINSVLEQMFREIMGGRQRPVRQIRIAMFNLERLDTPPDIIHQLHQHHIDDMVRKLNPIFLYMVSKQVQTDRVAKCVKRARRDEMMLIFGRFGQKKTKPAAILSAVPAQNCLSPNLECKLSKRCSNRRRRGITDERKHDADKSVVETVDSWHTPCGSSCVKKLLDECLPGCPGIDAQKNSLPARRSWLPRRGRIEPAL